MKMNKNGNAARAAHEAAESMAWLAEHTEHAADVARVMASEAGFCGQDAEVYVERFVGHLVNMAASGQGV